MAQVKVFYEPETELLTVFWQPSRKEQISTELDDYDRQAKYLTFNFWEDLLDGTGRTSYD